MKTTGTVIDPATNYSVEWTQRGGTAQFIMRDSGDGVVQRWANRSAGVGDAERMSGEALDSHRRLMGE